MATVKVKFRPSTKEGKEGTIFYKVIHKRVAAQVSTNIKVYSSEWDKTNGCIIVPVDSTSERSAYLMSIQGEINTNLSSLSAVVKKLDSSTNEYKATDVVRQYLGGNSSVGFISYARQTIAKLKAIGKPVATNYQAALNSLIRFHGEDEIPFDQFNQDLMTAYECHLRDSVCRNSSSCYMRNLHAIYNRAVEDGFASDNPNPFRRVYTGVDKTEKRALSAKAIKDIMDIDLSNRPALSFARDMFLFSFSTQGMSFIDMAYLTEENLKDGFLVYRRHKTQQTIKMKYVKEIESLVNKYSDSVNNPYLLPLLSTTDKDKAKAEYKAAIQRIDRNLKKVGKMLNLPIKLTMYVARHSWASIAQSQNVSIATISRCLGHDSEQTTAIYLADIKTSETDKANETVLRSVTQNKKKAHRGNV